MSDNRSYPKKKLHDLLHQMFYEFTSTPELMGEIHWAWEGTPSIQSIFEDKPELLRLFLDVWNYDTSPTTVKDVMEVKE